MRIPLIIAAVLTFGAGCAPDSKPVGRVSEDELRPTGDPSLKVPASWKPYDAGSSMRFASYVVEADGGRSVDISITPLDSAPGKDLAYVNLWRGTLGFEDSLEGDASELFTRKRFGELDFDLFDQTSPEPIIEGERYARIYLASITRGEKRWFFKMAGDAELVASQIETFHGMLATVSFGGEG